MNDINTAVYDSSQCEVAALVSGKYTPFIMCITPLLMLMSG